MLSFAQNFEDVMLERLFYGQTEGFYVDVGASHPIDLSVTKHFYDKGWSGINIEPLQSKYRLLLQHRPRDINLNVAVGATAGTLPFAEVRSNDALSTFDPVRATELETEGFEVRRYDVDVIGLNEILDRHAAGRDIEFLKVDVEGHEASVLKSIDLTRWRPKVLLIEAVEPMDEFPGWDQFDPLRSANWHQWEDQVILNGYVAAHFDGLNRFYVRQDLGHLARRLAIPPGVFDHVLRDIAMRQSPQTGIADLATLSHLNEDLLDEQSNLKRELQSKRTVIENNQVVIEDLARAVQSLTQLSNVNREGLIDYSTLRRELEAKQIVIDDLARAVQSYRLAVPMFSALDRRVHQTLSKTRALLRPRLGWLLQHPPRPFRLPRDNFATRVPASLPTISIVTPSYGQAAFIGRTMDSVLEQGYPKLEYFVQDGASMDRTVDILKRYEGRLSGWTSEPDSGQTQAINRGMAKTSGEIMGWLNSDDVLLPGTLNQVAAYFAEHPSVDVVYGHRIMIDENDQIVGRWLMPGHDDLVLSWADYIPQETMFWRRRIWEKVGAKLDESFSFAMDWDLILRFRDAGAKFARIPFFMGGFRIHAKQKTSAIISGVGQAEMDRLRQRTLGHVPSWLEVRKAVAPYIIRAVINDAAWRVRNRPGGPL